MFMYEVRNGQVSLEISIIIIDINTREVDMYLYEVTASVWFLAPWCPQFRVLLEKELMVLWTNISRQNFSTHSHKQYWLVGRYIGMYEAR